MIVYATFKAITVGELVDLCRKKRDHPLSASYLIGCAALPYDKTVYIDEEAYRALISEEKAVVKNKIDKVVINDIDTGEPTEVNAVVKVVEYFDG